MTVDTMLTLIQKINKEDKRMKLSKVIGRYNELEYEVELDGEVIYSAGNSPFDSQVYTDKETGVGLAVMKEYCEYTSREFAKEHKAKFMGVEYLEQ